MYRKNTLKQGSSSCFFSLADGVPHAQIPLPGELQQVNGTFHPISTPVISGRRAYILTQFIPEGQKVSILKKNFIATVKNFTFDLKFFTTFNILTCFNNFMYLH